MSSDANEIVCVLELTKVEVQALRALIGVTGGGSNEPNNALNDVYEALFAFSRDERVPTRRIVWDNKACKDVICVHGWEHRPGETV